MTTTDFKKAYWKYYLILEKDVLTVEPYVSFHPDNYIYFSTEFIKLYQTICSEIDVICKEYCKYIKNITSIKGKYRDIRDYAKYILTHHPEILSQKVHLLDGDSELIPWKEWHFDPNYHRDSSKTVTPEWWRKYNSIKHRRSDTDETGKYNYQYANLSYILNALAGLYVLEKYFYADLVKVETPIGKTADTMVTPESKLFWHFDFDEIILALSNIGI